jgi:hypothetical protein
MFGGTIRRKMKPVPQDDTSIEERIVSTKEYGIAWSKQRFSICSAADIYGWENGWLLDSKRICINTLPQRRLCWTV